MARMWVSPTEPTVLRQMADVVSMHPEDFGADVLVHGIANSVAIQRKEVNDLLSSLADGRLAEQVVKLQRADLALIVVEGPLHWTLNGELITNGWGESFTRSRWNRMILSLAQAGVVMVEVQDFAAMIVFVTDACRWADSTDHSTLQPKGRKVANEWGEKRVEHYQLAMLTTLPGVGIELARRIIKEVGFPFTLTAQLKDVKGVGPKKIAEITKIVEVQDESDTGSE